MWQEWIPIENAYPNDMEMVLLYDKWHFESIGYYYKSKNVFIRYSDGFRLQRVTHWIPLPIPPYVNKITQPEN